MKHESTWKYILRLYDFGYCMYSFTSKSENCSKIVSNGIYKHLKLELLNNLIKINLKIERLMVLFKE